MADIHAELHVSGGTVPIAANGIGTITVVAPPVYEGGYTFTPSDTRQTVPTGGKKLLEDITIKPIPRNYGLISWNGSVLTVS